MKLSDKIIICLEHHFFKLMLTNNVGVNVKYGILKFKQLKQVF